MTLKDSRVWWHTGATTFQQLELLPTISVSQADDLKREGRDIKGRYRIWISRCVPFQVSVERYVDNRWTTTSQWQDWPGL